MTTAPVTTFDHSYLTDTAGEYVVAETTSPNQPLVTVVAASSGRDIYTRGGIGPLVMPRSSLIIQPITGAITTTAFLTEFGNRLLTESGSFLSYP